jgi:hypothetical protein
MKLIDKLFRVRLRQFKRAIATKNDCTLQPKVFLLIRIYSQTGTNQKYRVSIFL